MGKKKIKVDKIKIDLQNQSSQTYIGKHDQAPQIDRINHIQKGYRINFNNPSKIIRSLFMFHNQSVNIWTHLCGVILVVCIICYVIFQLGSHQIDFQKKDFFENIQDYISDLKEPQFLVDLKQSANIKLKQMQRELKTHYGQFKQKIIEFKQIKKIGNQLKQFQHYMEIKFIQFYSKFKALQSKYINQMEQKISEFIHFDQIQNQLLQIKKSFINFADSQNFAFLDYTNTPNQLHLSKWPLLVFLASAICCLLFSTLFHLFYPMSKKTYIIFFRFDYAGINFLIAGSKFPMLYYGMYCQIQYAYIYLGISSICAVTLFILSMSQWMHSDKYRVFKAVAYASYGIYGIIPISHLFLKSFSIIESNDSFNIVGALPFLIGIGLSYLGGLYVYTVQCPQRHSPGKYDLCGQSHQIWHLCVVSGIIFTYISNLLIFQERKKSQCLI